MLQEYTFEKCDVSHGQRKSQRASVNIAIDIQDDDPFGTPPPSGHYQNGFACRGELTFEWPTSTPCWFKKMLEVNLTIYDQGDSSRLSIILLDMLDSAPGLPGALPGQPCRTKYITWSFICVKKPTSDGLALFPESIKRTVMKVYVFTRFPGFFYSTQTTAVVTAPTRQQAIAMLSSDLEKRGIAPLQEGGYAVVELDPTKAGSVLIADGSE
jgi:hypothetical protein